MRWASLMPKGKTGHNGSALRPSKATMHFLLLAVLALLMALAGCSDKSSATPGKTPETAAAKPQPKAVDVATRLAESRRLDRVVLVTGSLFPDETVTINSELIGKVVSVRADFGQSFRKGDVLAEIDPQEYQIQLERSRAALAQALARMGLKAGQENTPPESTPALRQVQAQMEDAKFKYESAAKLVQTGDISQDRFNELEKALRARQAAFEAARDEIRTQWSSADSLKADVKLFEKRLRDATLRAPFDGTVSQKHVSAGQYVRENAPILTVVKTNPLRLRLEVPETAAGIVRIGTTLTFTTDAIPGREFQAVVKQMNPSLDQRSRSLTSEARLLQTDPRLRPGMFAQVKLTLARDLDVVMVPRQALYTIAGLTKVFVIKDGKAAELRVTPGDERDGWVELPNSGVRPGDMIAVSAQAALVTGTPVTATRGRS